MLRVAIVEDDEEDEGLLSRFLERYGRESGEEFTVDRFTNAINFLTDYKAVYSASSCLKKSRFFTRLFFSRPL